MQLKLTEQLRTVQRDTLSLKCIICRPPGYDAEQLYSAASVDADGRMKLTVSSDREPSATLRCQSSSIEAVERRTLSPFFISRIGVGRWTNTRQRTHVGRPDRANTCSRRSQQQVRQQVSDCILQCREISTESWLELSLRVCDTVVLGYGILYHPKLKQWIVFAHLRNQ